jgi:hypothetical protein
MRNLLHEVLVFYGIYGGLSIGKTTFFACTTRVLLPKTPIFTKNMKMWEIWVVLVTDK